MATTTARRRLACEAGGRACMRRRGARTGARMERSASSCLRGSPVGASGSVTTRRIRQTGSFPRGTRDRLQWPPSLVPGMTRSLAGPAGFSALQEGYAHHLRYLRIDRRRPHVCNNQRMAVASGRETYASIQQKRRGAGQMVPLAYTGERSGNAGTVRANKKAAHNNTNDRQHTQHRQSPRTTTHHEPPRRRLSCRQLVQVATQ